MSALGLGWSCSSPPSLGPPLGLASMMGGDVMVNHGQVGQGLGGVGGGVDKNPGWNRQSSPVKENN